MDPSTVHKSLDSLPAAAAPCMSSSAPALSDQSSPSAVSSAPEAPRPLSPGIAEKIESVETQRPPTPPTQQPTPPATTPTTPKQEAEMGDTVVVGEEEGSMTESGYSNISSADGDDSDCWSVLSTEPVGRQWTVVWDEKEEEL